MLEVVFNDSEKGSMKAAKNYNAKTMPGGAVDYIGKKPTKAELEKYHEGQAVGGNPQDVVNIGFMLDIGDISGEIDGNERQDVFCKMWGRFNFDKKEQEQFSGINVKIWRSCCLPRKMVRPYEYGKAMLLILLVVFTMFAIY